MTLSFERSDNFLVANYFQMNYLEQFIQEARRLSGRDIQAKVGPRFTNLVYRDIGRQYIYARIDSQGNIYSQSGSKPRGNLQDEPYHGIDLIDKYGVIVNDLKYAGRLTELRGEITYPEAVQLMQSGEIVGHRLDPRLQKGVGPNHKITLMGRNGREYDVVADYADGQIYPPFQY